MVTGDLDSRTRFNKFHRQQMKRHGAAFEYPPGSIYDFQVNLEPWSVLYQSFEIDLKL